MIQINIETTGLDKAIDLLREFPNTLQQATNKSIAKSGETASKIARQSLQSGGHGKWPKPHPLTQVFRGHKINKWASSNRWNQQRSSYGGIAKFAQWVRYSMTDKSFITGFGTYPESASYKHEFKQEFMQYVKVLRGATIRVTDKMRRKMGATRWGKNATPGDNFFPLRASTKVLHVPKRLIEFDTQEIIDEFVQEMKKSF